MRACPGMDLILNLFPMKRMVDRFAVWLALVLCTGVMPGFVQAFEVDPKVTCHHVIRTNPNISLYWVWLNLADTNVTVQVAKAGNPPAAATNWVTSLLPTTAIAEREHFDFAVNGDFFDAEKTVDIEGKNTGYITGKAAAPIGPAMSDGKLWHHASHARPCLEITRSHTAKIYDYRPKNPLDDASVEMIGGGPILIRHGQNLIGTNDASQVRAPRTAVGIDGTGTRLLFLEVDGRQPNLSIGMTMAELAAEMGRLGCQEALNLDGGGSSTFVWRDGSEKPLRILNSPSDSKERAVANVIGATFSRPREVVE